jgi:hypothetical protein
MEMGNVLYWSQAIGGCAFKASHNTTPQHRRPGLHYAARNQRNLRPRSREGRRQWSHTVPSNPVSVWRGANSRLVMGVYAVAPTVMIPRTYFTPISDQPLVTPIRVNHCCGSDHFCPNSHWSRLTIICQAVDQKGRAARRRVDEHTTRTFLDPRICTSIRRMSALLAFDANPRMSSWQLTRSL